MAPLWQTHPRVSIIVPVYNQERYLEECVRSICRQTFTDWELILVNDGSSDSSGEIVGRFTDIDPRIKYLEQENGGVSSARNAGMRQATGEYLCFIDADDSIAPDFLECLVAASCENQSSLTVVGSWCCHQFPPDKIPALPTWGMFLRREVVEEHRLEFPEGIQPCEDGLFSHFVLALTDKIAFCPEAVYHYRQHQQGNHHQIRRQTAKILDMVPRWLSLLEKFYGGRKNLLEGKSGHLIRFIEHEPFEFRLLGMPFSPEEGARLDTIIRCFLSSHFSLEECLASGLHFPFRLFLKSSGFSDFKKRLRYAEQRAEFIRKISLLCPVPSWRRKARIQAKEILETLGHIRRNISF